MKGNTNMKQYIEWGQVQELSIYVIKAAKCHAINGKYSPDIDDVKAIETNFKT